MLKPGKVGSGIAQVKTDNFRTQSVTFVMIMHLQNLVNKSTLLTEVDWSVDPSLSIDCQLCIFKHHPNGYFQAGVGIILNSLN